MSKGNFPQPACKRAVVISLTHEKKSEYCSATGIVLVIALLPRCIGFEIFGFVSITSAILIRLSSDLYFLR
jgi:hypothetical protein